ncbi:hypothetical protein VNI00_019297 [Paramarasmius palmivorus]|uniref:C2H2-type domain-containing protein n=1 Tax=Paramarasmius palmivorus TaxID=297713 RepID=A0AAW0ANA4_9AGAR
MQGGLHERRPSFVLTSPNGDAETLQDSLFDPSQFDPPQFDPDALSELAHLPSFSNDSGDDTDSYLTSYHRPPSAMSSPTRLTPSMSSLGLATEVFATASFESHVPGTAAIGMMASDRKPPQIQTNLPSFQSPYSSSTGGITSASTQFSSWLPTPVTPSVPGTVPPNFLRLDKVDDVALNPALFRNGVYDEDTVNPAALRFDSQGRGRGLVPPPPGCRRRPRSLSVDHRRRDVPFSIGYYSHSVFNSPGALGSHIGPSQYNAQAASPGIGPNVNTFTGSLLFTGSSFEASADDDQNRSVTQIELEDGGVLGLEFEFSTGDTGNVQRRTIASDDVLKASKKRRKDSSQGEFKCHICSQDFTARHNLANHINAHLGIKRFECPHCHKHYTTKHVLDRHMKTAVGCRKARTAPRT